ncbi:L-glyceraldehyde 3-phosphate reductase [Algoriphagus sp. NF]|uniref:L-glyceraldehyde 3-phosphate reductase n=1 Tax=Algoriphagus sp. NF TaxID=2992756 RepID=UPI00237BC75C|nr:L-glyceraldehyde 3-phosphate reductase [Algoriphagus sp. NF]MDE0558353.1 L-glyceraldehyde 3-phosphate reductase [Algoriphagus sp. NF]
MQINDHNPLPPYHPDSSRYSGMKYRRTGRSGLLLPEISLGLWHNFGHNADFTLGRKILRRAFDLGITHFDLANNYGPPFGSAEENFGRILQKDFSAYRDELIISSKAGWDMWPGPYGNWGSRKYLIASCDQSLKRMGLDYVDIFYHHRPDPHTPLEETMGALDQLVRQGKALYVGISQYSAEETAKAYQILKDLGTPLLIHQPRYSMLDRWVEDGLLDVLGDKGVGSIAFSPLEQGLLTDKYLKGIPEDSRAAKDGRYLKPEQISDDKIEMIKQLNEIAIGRGQTLAQMAIAWLLKDSRITSVLVGVSKPEQLDDNVSAIGNSEFSVEEITKIKSLIGAK